MNTIAYPRLIKRIRAALIDSVLLPVAVFSALILGEAFGVSYPSGKVMLILAPIFVLEPGLVAFTGGTVGHHLMKIRITRIDGRRNLNVVAATVRFIVKLLLGWLSFILVLTTAKHQAVHDFIARSMVIHKDTEGLPAFEVLPERMLDSVAFVYPSTWHRIIVITGYAILATVIFSIATALASTTECMESHRCTTLDKLFETILSISWIVGLGWLTVRGWNGMLYGCKKRRRKTAA